MKGKASNFSKSKMISCQLAKSTEFLRTETGHVLHNIENRKFQNDLSERVLLVFIDLKLLVLQKKL